MKNVIRGKKKKKQRRKKGEKGTRDVEEEARDRKGEFDGVLAVRSWRAYHA